MYLIIEKDYTLSKTAVLTGSLRLRTRTGNISLVDCKTMRGMNTATYPYSDHGDWSNINEYVPLLQEQSHGINRRMTMTPHIDKRIEYAEDELAWLRAGADKSNPPWNGWEFRLKDKDDWVICGERPKFCVFKHYRRKDRCVDNGLRET